MALSFLLIIVSNNNFTITTITPLMLPPPPPPSFPHCCCYQSPTFLWTVIVTHLQACYRHHLACITLVATTTSATIAAAWLATIHAATTLAATTTSVTITIELLIQSLSWTSTACNCQSVLLDFIVYIWTLGLLLDWQYNWYFRSEVWSPATWKSFWHKLKVIISLGNSTYSSLVQKWSHNQLVLKFQC